MKIATALGGTYGTMTRFFDSGSKIDIALPEGIKTLSSSPDTFGWRRGRFSRTFFCGGHSETIILTERMALVRVNIAAPTKRIETTLTAWNTRVAAAASPGLSGECSFAFRWLDSKHQRRSPLGPASDPITLSHSGATFTQAPMFPVPADPYVDKLEIWVSVDGGLYRNWAAIDAGTSTFTINVTTTGSAYTTELLPFPECAIGCMANDRRYAAGNKDQPQRIFISEVGAPDQYAGFSIDTPNQEPIIGLKEVGSSVYVQCQNSSYYVQGFGVRDISMKLLKANIGGFGQRTIVKLDDVAMIPTQRGWYRFDGSSMVPIGVGYWDETWRKTVSTSARRSTYQDGFCVADYVSGVLKFLPRRIVNAGEATDPLIIGFPAASGVSFKNTYWVVNFAGLVPELGGSGLADLSFDQYVTDDHTCASMLFDQDAVIGGFYVGTIGGDILIENQPNLCDRNTNNVITAKTFILHTSHDKIGPVVSDEDAFQVTDAWLNAQCDEMNFTFGLYCGSEFAWQSGAQSPVGTPTDAWAPVETFAVVAGSARPPGVSLVLDNRFVPKDKYVIQSLAESSGSSISARMTVTQSTDKNTTNRAVLQRALVVFTGWGYVAQPGEDRRPIARYVA